MAGKKKDFPLMHPVQLNALVEFIQLEIEFAFSVENGGRYNRADLRRRMRMARKYMTDVLTEKPMSYFDMGPEDEDGHNVVGSEGEEEEEEEEEDEEKSVESTTTLAALVDKNRQSRTLREVLKLDDDDDEPKVEATELGT